MTQHQPQQERAPTPTAPEPDERPIETQRDRDVSQPSRAAPVHPGGRNAGEHLSPDDFE